MAQTATLSAAIRQDTGKGAARSLRRQGKVPGVIYGHGRTAEALVVDTVALNKMLIGSIAYTWSKSIDDGTSDRDATDNKSRSA